MQGLCPLSAINRSECFAADAGDCRRIARAAWLRPGNRPALPRAYMGHARRSMHGICQLLTLFNQLSHFEPAFCKSVPKLAFNDEGTFKVLQLADLHYGHFPELDEHTDKACLPFGPVQTVTHGSRRCIICICFFCAPAPHGLVVFITSDCLPGSLTILGA